jgi:hypothetical protein
MHRSHGFPRRLPWHRIDMAAGVRRLSLRCALFCVVATALHPQAAGAQSLQCAGNLVGIGESRASLLQKCGEPIARDLLCRPVAPQERLVATPGGGWLRIPFVPPCIPMEEWTYHRGEGNFLGIVRFANGVVESVRDGERMR